MTLATTTCLYCPTEVTEPGMEVCWACDGGCGDPWTPPKVEAAAAAVVKATKALKKAKGPTAILYAQLKLAQAEDAYNAALTEGI